MDLGQISDEDRLKYAKTIAAYGTHEPTIEQRQPNLRFVRSMRIPNDPGGPVDVFVDDADGSRHVIDPAYVSESR